MSFAGSGAGASTIPVPVLRSTALSGGGGLLGGLSSVAGSISEISPVISSVAGVIGGNRRLQAGIAQQSAAAVQTQQNIAAINDFNAQVATQNAQIARETAATQAAEKRSEAKKLTSVIRARFAAGGVVTSAGSPLLAQAAQQAEGAAAAERELYKGKLQARGFESQARLDRFKADIARNNAGIETQAGKVRANTQLIQGIDEVTTVGTSIL